MKRPDSDDYRRESVAATAWLVLFAILVVGAAQQRLSWRTEPLLRRANNEYRKENEPSCRRNAFATVVI